MENMNIESFITPYNIVNVSGGVDSTACYLLRLEHGADFRAVFADTGNEHEATLDYIRELPERTGGPPAEVFRADFAQHMTVRRMKLERMLETDEYDEGWDEENVLRVLENLHPSGNPFLDLCLHKGRFPSVKGRFCTGELKLAVLRANATIPAIVQATRDGLPASAVVTWVGIRRDESAARADAELWEYEHTHNRIYRPLVEWSKQDCFDLLKRHGVQPNPLYAQGCARVGCMPCIMARKDEILEISQRWPHHIDRIREWEHVVSLCSKRGISTFFASDKVPGKGDMRANIDAVVEWSKTGRGGIQYDMLRQEEPPACSSMYGLCE